MKPIPFSMGLEINAEGQINNPKNLIYTQNEDGTVTINLDGYGTYTFDRMTLAGVAYWRIDTPPSQWANLVFYKVDIKLNKYPGKLVPYYREPVEMKYNDKQYRQIPGLFQYWVTKSGQMISITKGRKIREIQPGYWNTDVSGNPTYKHVRIVFPFRDKPTSSTLHKLVAMAWVHNPHPDKWFLVNHDDGDKSNPHADNLEWCDYTHNINHAFESGLRNDNTPIKARDIFTGEVHTFYSLGSASALLGSTGFLCSHLNSEKKYPLKGRYEVKELTDDSPWVLTKDSVSKPTHYVYHLYVIDGGEELGNFYNIYDIYHYLEIDMPEGLGFKHHEKKLADLGFGVTRKMRYTDGPFEARRYSDRSVVKAERLGELARKVGASTEAISYIIRAGRSEVVTTSGYQFRRCTDEPWPENVVFSQRKKKCIYVHPKGSAPQTYKSVREAERETGLNQKLISKALRTERRNVRFKGELWLVYE